MGAILPIILYVSHLSGRSVICRLLDYKNRNEVNFGNDFHIEIKSGSPYTTYAQVLENLKEGITLAYVRVINSQFTGDIMVEKMDLVNGRTITEIKNNCISPYGHPPSVVDMICDDFKMGEDTAIEIKLPSTPNIRSTTTFYFYHEK